MAFQVYQVFVVYNYYFNIWYCIRSIESTLSSLVPLTFCFILYTCVGILCIDVHILITYCVIVFLNMLIFAK